MADSFDADWAPGDILTAVELNKVGMVKIADSTLAIAAASIDLQSISQVYAHLRIIAELRSDQASAAAAYLRFNNDSGSNYRNFSGVGGGAAPAAVAQIQLLDNINESDSNADLFSIVEIVIANYANAVHNKTVLARGSATMYDGANSVTSVVHGMWISTAAINRVTLLPSTGNFAAESRVTLYGMRD